MVTFNPSQNFEVNLGSSIGHNPLGHSMQTDYPRHIQLCKLWSSVGRLNGYEVSYFG
jgi:hypothetical protein